MQRREQQKRAAAGGGGASYLGGGITGYSPVPQRFDAPEPSTARNTGSPVPASGRAPAFKGSGMKLGSSKRTKQAELLDALGAEAFTPEEIPLPTSPIPAASEHVEPVVRRETKSSMPTVTPERHVTFQLFLSFFLPPIDDTVV